MELRHAIIEVVTENSGGVKFTKLLTEVTSRYMRGEIINMKKIENIHDEENRDTSYFIERVISEIELMANVKILKYTWRDIARQKWFVYTP